MKKKEKISLFWFRRDLRLDDNKGLYEALKGDYPVIPLFIFDKEILNKLPNNDHRVSFIFETLQNMRNKLQDEYNSSIDFRYGKPEKIFKDLIQNYDIAEIYTNNDYEPYAQQRDDAIKKLLDEHDINFHTFKDQVIFEKDEVVKDDGDPYVVYTPYKNKWREKFNASNNLEIYYINDYTGNFYQNTRLPQITLSDMGFKKSSIVLPEFDVTPTLIAGYADTRDFPAENGTSHLGPYLRFGLVSIRKMMKKAYSSTGYTFMNELIWREFFMQILWHFPHTANQAFREKYDTIPWRDAPDDLQKWKDGRTGYPVVGAGMRR